MFNINDDKKEQNGSDFAMLKSHIKGYIKLDGAYVADHEDKRSKNAVDYNSTGKHRAIWVGSKKQYAVQHPDGSHLSYHATLAEAKDAVAVHRKKLKGEANKVKRDPGHGDVLAGGVGHGLGPVMAVRTCWQVWVGLRRARRQGYFRGG